MQTKTNYTLKIERGLTKLITLHEPKGSSKVFVYPSIGPNTYQNVGREILKQNYKLPEANETASLLHAAYLSELKDEPEFQHVREILKNQWLWVFNRKLWADNGVYTIFDPTAQGLNEELTVEHLEKRLNGGKELKGIEVRMSEDNTVRFAPKGSYTLGEHTSESLAKDGNVISEYLQEGAEKLGETAETFNRNPYVWGLNIDEGANPILRVSAVVDCVGRLLVDGNLFGNGRDGHAFGVL